MMPQNKPHVAYLSDRQEMVDLIEPTLSQNFKVTAVTGVTGLDGALDAIRQIAPDYILVDRHLSGLDHQKLYRQLKADEQLKTIQILVISDDESGLAL